MNGHVRIPGYEVNSKQLVLVDGIPLDVVPGIVLHSHYSHFSLHGRLYVSIVGHVHSHSIATTLFV